MARGNRAESRRLRAPVDIDRCSDAGIGFGLSGPPGVAGALLLLGDAFPRTGATL